MKWDNPEPGIYEAMTTRTQAVTLEVFEPAPEDDAGRYQWWAIAGGRVIADGETYGLSTAMAQCVEAIQ